MNRWNDYWFRPAPLLNLAICRILIVGFQLGYLTLMNYKGRLMHLALLPDDLYDPLPVLRLLLWPFKAPFGDYFAEIYRPSSTCLETVYWITTSAGALALMGLVTNLFLAIFALGNIFIQAFLFSFGEFHRPQAFMMIALIILALSPAGRVLSIDDIKQGLKGNFFQECSAFAGWPLLLIQWMFALIYLSATKCKLMGQGFDWLNGHTLQYYLLEDSLRSGSVFGLWLSSQHSVAWLLSWIMMLFEGTFFLVLIFPKLAWIYLPLGIVLHTGIYFTMKARFFQYVAIYAVFVPWTSIAKAFCLRLKLLRESI